MWLNKTCWLILAFCSDRLMNLLQTGQLMGWGLIRVGRGLGGSTKFYTGRLRPKAKSNRTPYPFIYHFTYMVRISLKRSWILPVVFKTPWIQFRSLKSTWFLYKVLKLKSLKFTTLSTPDTFFCKIRNFFGEETLAHSRGKNLKTHR